jgi:hypothetical protein
MRQLGQLAPILVAKDRETVLSGWRRVTALRALKKTTIDAKVYLDIAADSPEAVDILLASNEQREMTYAEKIHALQAYEKAGLSLRAGATRVGISPTEASFLAKLAKAPEEVRAAIDAYDRSGGKRGMSFGAFKQIANLPTEKQKDVVAGSDEKRVTMDKAQRARKKHVAEAAGQGDRLTEEDEAMAEVSIAFKEALLRVLGHLASADDKALARGTLVDIVRPHRRVVRRVLEILEGE